MGNATYHTPKRYIRKGAAAYADYYEAEDETFRYYLHRFKDAVRSRYKLFTDSSRQRKRRNNELKSELQDLGLRGLDLIKPEVFYLASVLRPGEKMRAAVSGRVDGGASVLIVITESRILYLNVIPFFTTVEEIGYGVVEAVSMSIGQFDASVSLFTGIGNFTLKRVGLDAAKNFTEVAERVIEAGQSGGSAQTA